MKKPRVVELGQKDEMKAAYEALKRELPSILDHVCIVAQIRKANYEAHMAQGFTEEQALELCKSIQL